MEAEEERLLEEDLSEVLRDAIQEERASQDRYLKALDQARSPASQALFQELLEHERQHQRLLEERYGQIKKQLEVKIIGKWARWVKPAVQ